MALINYLLPPRDKPPRGAGAAAVSVRQAGKPAGAGAGASTPAPRAIYLRF